MKFFKCSESPIRVYGLPQFYENGSFYRLPEELMLKVDTLGFLGRRSAGGRIVFKTNAKSFTIKMRLQTLGLDICIPIVGSAGADVYLGRGKNAKFIGSVFPSNYNEDSKMFEKTFINLNEYEDVTIFLPRNEIIENIEIGIDDDAMLLEPEEYKYVKPVLFYGSSITEGGCASRVGNAYTAILSRWLDTDIINYGFSGSARGEEAMAEHIKKMDMSIFVMDYDHNSEPDQLEQRHQNFFNIIRKEQPTLPIVMISRPDIDYAMEESVLKRQTILNTYNYALSMGDKNVYFIDGETLFGKENRCECTVDTVHPNDLGFLRMAQTIYPVLNNILIRKE